MLGDSTMGIWGPIKPIEQFRSIDAEHRLRPSLSWPHLIALGVGAIVGTGIYTLTGVGADRAGPAVVLSFLVAGVVCACAALAYAELATLIPTAGSAYTYTYSVARSEEHTSELQSHVNLVCRLLLEKKKKINT